MKLMREVKKWACKPTISAVRQMHKKCIRNQMYNKANKRKYKKRRNNRRAAVATKTREVTFRIIIKNKLKNKMIFIEKIILYRKEVYLAFKTQVKMKIF